MTHGISTMTRLEPLGTYGVMIGSQVLQLPKFKMESGITIAILNLLGGDPLLINDVARHLGDTVIRMTNLTPNYPDVLSTGSTVGAMINMLTEAEANLVGIAVVAVEGEQNTTLEALKIPTYSLVNLPIWGPE